MDMYFWVHGTEAMALVGGKRWKMWKKALMKALVTGQEKRGHVEGSWDPNGPWGVVAGRVYSTAILAIALNRCLE